MTLHRKIIFRINFSKKLIDWQVQIATFLEHISQCIMNQRISPSFQVQLSLDEIESHGTRQNYDFLFKQKVVAFVQKCCEWAHDY